MTAKAWREAEAMSKLATTAAYTRAFDTWETRFREHPEQFMTSEEMAAAEVLTLSEQRAAYFEAILKAMAVSPGNVTP
jgi:hypothetical protein